MKTLSLVILLAATGVAPSALAQAPDAQAFVTQAAQDGMTEVALGRLAGTKGQHPDVKKFADRMVADHGKANKELEALAKAKGLEVPTQLDAQHQSTIKMLESKAGADFDAAYSQHMAADHAKAIALFEAASRLSDVELAGFAKKTLPTLQEHKQLADGLKAKTAAGTGTP